MQLLYKEGFNLIAELKNKGHNIFIDLKIYDIPNTSKKAIESLASYKPDFISVHSSNSLKALIDMQNEAVKNKIKLLAVTVLTSLDENDLKAINIKVSLKEQVETLIKLAKKANIYGILSSAEETKIVKKYNLKSITPGIRLSNSNNNDQKRVVTPKTAFSNGSDFIVVGRAITTSKNPLETYKIIEQEIK